MKATCLIMAAVCFSCSQETDPKPLDAPETGTQVVRTEDLLGDWMVTWMGGYVTERCTITNGPTPQTLRLDYYQDSDVGDFEFHYLATHQKNSLVLDAGYNQFGRAYGALEIVSLQDSPIVIPEGIDAYGRPFASLSIATTGEAFVLVPSPNPGCTLGGGRSYSGPKGAYPAVYHKEQPAAQHDDASDGPSGRR